MEPPLSNVLSLCVSPPTGLTQSEPGGRSQSIQSVPYQTEGHTGARGHTDDGRNSTHFCQVLAPHPTWWVILNHKFEQD